MKIERKEIPTVITQEIYITEDGKKFTDRTYAECHERNIMLKSLKDSPEIISKESELYPYEEYMSPDSKDYMWYKPLSEKGVELLNKVYDCPYGDSPKVGEWICYEVYDYDADINSYTLRETIARFIELLKSLDYDVNLELKKVVK